MAHSSCLASTSRECPRRPPCCPAAWASGTATWRFLCSAVTSHSHITCLSCLQNWSWMVSRSAHLFIPCLISQLSVFLRARMRPSPMGSPLRIRRYRLWQSCSNFSGSVSYCILWKARLESHALKTWMDLYSQLGRCHPIFLLKTSLSSSLRKNDQYLDLCSELQFYQYWLASLSVFPSYSPLVT